MWGTSYPRTAKRAEENDAMIRPGLATGSWEPLGLSSTPSRGELQVSCHDPRSLAQSSLPCSTLSSGATLGSRKSMLSSCKRSLSSISAQITSPVRRGRLKPSLSVTKRYSGELNMFEDGEHVGVSRSKSSSSGLGIPEAATSGFRVTAGARLIGIARKVSETSLWQAYGKPISQWQHL